MTALFKQFNRFKKATTRCLTDHIFMVTTDGGPNEQQSRKLSAAEVMDIPNVYFLQQDCLEHSPHLVVMSSLLLVDELLEKFANWKYWSSLAMFAHTCRDQARSLYEVYSSRYGASEAKNTVKTLFPRPVSQRWGRIHDLEKRIMNAGFQQLAICVSNILTRKWIDFDEIQKGTPVSTDSSWADVAGYVEAAIQSARKSPPQETDTKDCKTRGTTKTAVDSKNKTPNELSVEQTKEYTLKIGRWRARTLQTLGDQLWGMVIKVMHHSRSPLIHISNFLKVKQSRDDMIEKGGPLAQLVFGRAATIFGEFTKTLTTLRTCS